MIRRAAAARLPELAFAAFLAAAPTPLLGQPAEAEGFLARGAAAYAAGDFGRAHRSFSEAARVDPTGRADVLCGRALEALARSASADDRTGLLQSASSAYRIALEKDADDDEAWSALVLLHRTAGDAARVREWRLWRANDAEATRGRRAEAFRDLAGDAVEALTPLASAFEAETRARRRLDARKLGAARTAAAEAVAWSTRATELDVEDEAGWSRRVALQRLVVRFARLAGDARGAREAERDAGVSAIGADEARARSLRRSEPEPRADEPP